MQKSSKDPVFRFQGMCLYAECILFDYAHFHKKVILKTL